MMTNEWLKVQTCKIVGFDKTQINTSNKFTDNQITVPAEDLTEEDKIKIIDELFAKHSRVYKRLAEI